MKFIVNDIKTSVYDKRYFLSPISLDLLVMFTQHTALTFRSLLDLQGVELAFIISIKKKKSKHFKIIDTWIKKSQAFRFIQVFYQSSIHSSHKTAYTYMY